MPQSSELKGIISDIDGVPGGTLPPLLALVREDSQINFVTRNVPWIFGGGEGVLSWTFLVTNKHRFLSTQNFQ